jgi:hypothetical protein
MSLEEDIERKEQKINRVLIRAVKKISWKIQIKYGCHN